MSTRYLWLTSLIGVMLVVVACPYSSAARWGQWQNSLKPKGEGVAEIALAVGGQTDYVIVVPESPTTQEQKAAEDLAQWLGEMTGAEFAVVSDADPAQDTEISVGRTSRLAAANLAVAGQDLGDEGYAIAVKGSRLFLIGGKKRGPIYAAFAFMEEDLGLRWYTAEASRVLRRPSVRVRVVPRSYVPPLAIRDPYSYDAFDATWSLRNRTNSVSGVPEKWGGHINYALSVHTFNTLVPPSQYFKEHPEYYSEHNGKRDTRQLCLTNPEVVKIATQSALRILKERPDCEIISISQNDGGGYCQCPKCRALDEAEGSHAAQLIHFVNQVAAGIEKEYPDVLISTLAYSWSIKAPKTLRPRKNVAIRICTDTCMWTRPFVSVRNDEGPVLRDWAEDPSKLSFKKFFLEWRKVTDNISIWDYWTNFANYLAPMPNMEVVADNIRFFTEHKVAGIFAEDEVNDRAAMKNWVYAKLLWDPSRNVRELMKDFIWGYYGRAAPAIAEYNELLRSLREGYPDVREMHGWTLPSGTETDYLSGEFLDGATVLFNGAERMADNEEIRHRVERDRLSIMYVKLMHGPEFVIKRGEDYPALIDRFATIARRENITRTSIISGRRTLDETLKQWRDEWRVYNEIAQIKPGEVELRPLANQWRFATDPDDVGVSEKWFAPSFDDAKGAQVRSDLGMKGWESQGFSGYTGYGWYRQSFTPLADLDREHVYLYFGAVDEDAWIYLNGKLALDHSCGATGLTPGDIWTTPILFDPGAHLKPGQLNSLAVRVYNSVAMGGIWKPVYVIASDRELYPALIGALLEREEPKQ